MPIDDSLRIDPDSDEARAKGPATERIRGRDFAATSFAANQQEQTEDKRTGADQAAGGDRDPVISSDDEPPARRDR
jgi:hypothetical protein